MEDFSVERAPVQETFELRHQVLRPGRPFESVHLPGDEEPSSGHFVARRVGTSGAGPGEVVTTGTILLEAPPWDPTLRDAWRIRGMATREGFRGMGLGRRVLDALLSHGVNHGGKWVWCNAREGALEFYRRALFEPTGELFDDGIALHQPMWRAL